MCAIITMYGDAGRGIISSRDFSAFSMAEQYRVLSERTSLDFAAAIGFLENLPIFLSGDRHKKTRRSLAEIYARTRHKQEFNVNDALKDIEKTLKSTNGYFDVMEKIANPLWVAVSDAISESLVSDSKLAAELPDLFYPSLSIRKRKALNDRLADVLGDASIEDKQNILDGLALLTLGVRPLVHSLSLSIYGLAKANNMKILSTIDYPATFLDSSLRFIDRVANSEVVVQGCPHEAGARFRCISFDEGYSDIENAKFLFGAGNHLCLGRPISAYIWQGLTCVLSKIEKTISPGDLILRSQEPFKMAEKCTVVLGENI